MALTMPRTALIIRHVPYEGVAGFLPPIEAAGYEVERIDVCDPQFASRDLVGPDLLIMMGGPMSLYDSAQHPWIPCQLRRLERRLAADRPTLGVCLGAQMIAAALGARVFRGPRPEIGFAPLTLLASGRDGPLRHLGEQAVLHWHSDTFDLPEGAELLASTPAYAHQAFRWGRGVLGLQFHAEMGLDPRIEGWIEQTGEGLDEAGTDAERIRDEYARHGPAAVSAGQAMLTAWLGDIAASRIYADGVERERAYG